MSNFKGYLIKFIDPTNAGRFKTLKNKYISLKSYKTKPQQRLEVEAYRDANALLHRLTAPNFKTKIEFQTLGNLSLADKEDLFSDIEVGRYKTPAGIIKREYKLEYWDDEDSNYVTTGTRFYMPDVEFTIKRITEDGDNSNIVYDPIRIAFIEN